MNEHRQKVKMKGKCQLTANTIKLLTKYYGSAIRSNVGNPDQIKESVITVYHHSRTTDSEPHHHHCPTGIVHPAIICQT